MTSHNTDHSIRDVDPAHLQAPRQERPMPLPEPALAGASLLDAVEDAFAVLVTGPGALALDRRTIEGLPRRRMPLGEVRDLLLSPQAGYPLRDRIWTVVIETARGGTRTDGTDGPHAPHRKAPEPGVQAGDKNWRIAAVALGLPGLKRVAARLSAGLPPDQVADLESEMLTGYLAAMQTIELSTGRIASRLCWAAYRAADRYRHLSPARSGVTVPMGGSMPPPRPWGHPDFVLARYVVEGLLSQYEAELIACTRLEGVTFEELERQWRLPRATLAGDRARAEARLVPLLRGAHPASPAAGSAGMSSPSTQVTNGSRSGAASDLGGSDPDSEGAGVERPGTTAAA